MQKKWHIMLWMVILAIGLVGFAGCSDDDDDDNTVMPTIKPYVYAMAFNEESGPRKAEDDPGYAVVSVSDSPVVPGCTINGEAMSLDPEMTVYGGSLGFSGEFEFGADNAVQLAIDLDGETGGATLLVPGEFDVVGDPDVDLEFETAHTFSWTPSAGAELYWVWADFEADYVDTNGVTHYWENQWNSTTTGTSLALAADQMFPMPGDLDYYTYFWGDLDVTAVTGPIEAGDGTNITGAVTGYLVGVGGSVDWDIDEVSTAKSVRDQEQDIDLLDSYVRRMR